MKIPIVTGPTASGKSRIAYNLALETGAEIISADAFQVYKYLDIGTAKVSIEEQSKVKHHLIDNMMPDECYSAGIFVEEAEKIIDDVLSRGKVPIIAGGTGLYIKSLTKGIFDCPDIDISVREELQSRAEKEGLQNLYNELLDKDREYALKISENDPARIIRALEVYYGLGMKFTEAHKLYTRSPKYEYIITVPDKDRAILYQDINARTEEMWEMGWKNEVEKLLDMGYNDKCPSFRAIGYKAITDLIINGGDERKVIDRIAKETRNFAKRQLTWFRHQESSVIYDSNENIFNILLKYIKETRGIV